MKVTIECNHIGLIKLVQAIENVSSDWEAFQDNPYREDVESVTKKLSDQVRGNEKEFEERIQVIREELDNLDELVWPVG